MLAFMICALPTFPWTSCLWKYSAGVWTNITPAGPNPPAEVDENFVWDAADQVALLVGGLTYPTAVTGLVWQFKGGNWSNITTASSPHPARVLDVEAAYDSADGYVVSLWQRLNGQPANYTFASYTYAFRAGIWTNVTATAGGAALPFQPAFADDPTDGGAVLFGGRAGSSLVATNQTWLFSHGMWRELAPIVAPLPRMLESVAYDSLLPAVLMVGGTTNGCPATCPAYTDEWTFAHSEWTNITATLRGDPPTEVYGQMVTDVADGYVLEGFGSPEYSFNGSPYQTDLYEFANGTWTAVSPSGSPPVIAWATAVALVVGLIGVSAVGILLWRRRRKGTVVDRPPEVRHQSLPKESKPKVPPGPR